MSKIEKAVSWAIDIANDNTHGYSQAVRWGPSYDCSSLVISAFEQAGIPVKTMGATYTGNMREVFKRAGFIEVSRPYKRGDVLLNDANHTALMISPTQLVHASSSFGTTDTADNNGREIRIQDYYDFPWNVVLRYPEEDVPDINDDNIEPDEEDPEDIELYPEQDLTHDAMEALQLLLEYRGFKTKSRKLSGRMDGEYGPGTEAALIAFQGNTKITEETWHKLIWRF